MPEKKLVSKLGDCHKKQKTTTSASRKRKSISSHIKQIKDAKNATADIFASIKIDTAQASVEILWEFVFDYLCSLKSVDSSEMGTLSSIIQRLASSRVQLANFASKTSVTSQRSNDGTLPDDVAEKIEEALNLL